MAATIIIIAITVTKHQNPSKKPKATGSRPLVGTSKRDMAVTGRPATFSTQESLTKRSYIGGPVGGLGGWGFALCSLQWNVEVLMNTLHYRKGADAPSYRKPLRTPEMQLFNSALEFVVDCGNVHEHSL